MDSKIFATLVLIAFVFVIVANMTQNNVGTIKITSNAVATTKVMVYGGCYWVVYPGWDYLAFCSNTSNTIEDIENNVGHIKFILKWNNTKQAFDVYSPRAAENPFNKINYNESFFILFEPSNNSRIVVDNPGNEINTLTFNIVTGWNAIPYPYTTPVALTSATSPFGDYRFILKWNPVFQKFDVYSSKSATNNLPDINVGEAFFIFMNNNEKVLYNQELS